MYTRKPWPSARTAVSYTHLDVYKRQDLVLLMTVNPGFGGQSLIPEVLPKIKAVKGMLEERGLKAEIQVDGGINNSTAAAVTKAGADVLVAGSAIFGRKDPAAAVRELRKAALRG